MSVCGLYPDSIKMHSYNTYSIYMPSFNKRFLVVYPVGVTIYIIYGVTDLPPFIMQIIGYNSIGFQPKSVWNCILMSPICLPSFSLIGVCIHILRVKIRSMENKENKKNLAKICMLESQIGWCNLLQIWCIYRFA